jgi:hypothetical protein
MPALQNLKTPGSHGASPSPETDPQPKPRASKTPRIRNGKVARLPKKTRDAICEMLQDGRTSADILTELGSAVTGVSAQNISQWKKGGYQDWLEEQRWIAQMVLLRENSADLIANFDVLKIHRAAIQLAVIQIFQALKREEFKDDPQNYARTLNALSRLSREALVLAKYQEIDRPTCYDDEFEDDDDQGSKGGHDPLAFTRDLLPALAEARRKAALTPPVPPS